MTPNGPGRSRAEQVQADLVDRPPTRAQAVLVALRRAVHALDGHQLHRQPLEDVPVEPSEVREAAVAYLTLFDQQVKKRATHEEIERAEMVRVALESGGALRITGFVASDPNQYFRMHEMIKDGWFECRGVWYVLVKPRDPVESRRWNIAAWT